MKKVFAIFLLLSLCLGLCACGSNEKAVKLQEDLAANSGTLREKYGDDCIISLNEVYIVCGAKAAVSDATGNQYS